MFSRFFVINLCLGFTAMAQWNVPERAEPISVEVIGTTEISRASVMTIRSGSPGGIVSWIGPDGYNAAFGDVLMTIDTEGLKREYSNLVQRIAVEQRTVTNENAWLIRRLAEEEEAYEVMKEDLLIKEAAAIAASKSDPDLIAAYRRQIELAKQTAALQDAELARQRNLYELGQLARVDLENAELTTAAAHRSVRIAELILKDAGDGSDDSRARLASVELAKARATIGVDDKNQPQPHLGHGKKISKTKAELQRHLKSRGFGVNAMKISARGHATAAWPHLPIASLEVLRGSNVLHRIAADDPNAEANYEATRGSGWLGVPTLIRTPGKSGKPGSIAVRGQAQWRCDLPAGRYTVRFELGDDTSEYSCLSVRVAEPRQILLAENHVEQGQRVTRSAEVDVGADGLVLDLGLAVKSVLASQAGAVKNQTWLHLGHPIRNNPPALYLTPEARLVAKLRVHHMQVPFFEDSPAVARTLDLQTVDGRWIAAGKVSINEDPVAFFPSKDSGHHSSVDQPEERTAREVTIEVPAQHAEAFAFAAHVNCRATIEPKPGSVLVPAHLVREAEHGLVAQRAGEAIDVTGTRYDQHVLLTSGVAPGEALEIPDATTGSEHAERRFTGEVVAGVSVPMVVPINSWARIESLVPHGSFVREGDLVMTLYRPKENEKAAAADAKAVKAEARFLDAIDEQEKAFLRDRNDHAAAIADEQSAAERVAENRRLDEADLASASEDERAANAELRLLDERLTGLQGLDAVRLEFEDTRRRRDILRLEASRRELNTIATERGVDFTKQLQDRVRWRRARTELALRESKIDISLRQQDVLGQQALNLLENDLEDQRQNNDFDSQRFLHAPAAGHVFYKTGYNDLVRRNERIQAEFVVWNGLSVAEITDMGKMDFQLSIPERFYHVVEVDMELPLQLEDLGDRLLPAKVVRKGRTLHPPRRGEGEVDRAIALRRVFDVTLSFAAPKELRDQLRPGLRGAVTLP